MLVQRSILVFFYKAEHLVIGRIYGGMKLWLYTRLDILLGILGPQGERSILLKLISVIA
jgi:hypothetical protein